jgi:dihydroneopterin aldolase
MEKKLWIGLEGMEFYAYHGYYEEERKTGGRYVVDVMVYTNAELAETLDDLSGTVNYEQIYAIVQLHMNEPVKLIEHLASKIMGDLRKFILKDDFIRIKIQKLDPPLNGKVAAAVVLLEE